MANLALWKSVLLTRSRASVITFKAGLRHPVRPETVCGLHCHPTIEIVYHPVGRGRTLLNGRPLEFGENSVVIYAPGEPHDQTMSEKGEDLCLQLALPKSFSIKVRTGFYLGDLKVAWIIGEIRQLSCRIAPACGMERSILDLRATSVLLALIDANETESRNPLVGSGERHVIKAERFMQEHFSSIRSLGDVARHLQISHDHLRHLYKSLRRESLTRYLNDVRVARAKLLLTSSPLPLKQIANLCGFQDEYYFSTVFRRQASMPPGVYRLTAAPN